MYDRVFFSILILSIVVSIAAIRNHTTLINVVEFGAEPDGSTDSSSAFLDAWDSACKSSGKSKIFVPKGKYLISSPVSFKGRGCKSRAITIKIDGTLMAPSNYAKLAESPNWIIFRNTNRVTVIGGILDAKGSGLWACKSSDDGNCPQGASSMQFSNSKNVIISGLTSLNSQMFHIVIHKCYNVKLQGMKIIAPDESPNTDGIHISHSSDVKVMNSNVRTGDDCISIGPGTTNLWIENIYCGPGHGISIGSLGKEANEGGVQNVTVMNSKFTGTQNGLRIKSWQKRSSGFVKGVLFKNATMVDVKNPIIIDQHYCNGKQNCPMQGPGIKISDVTYQNIRGTSVSEVALNFDCNKEKPCSGIKLKGVDVKYVGSEDVTVKSECSNVVGGSASGVVSPASCI